MAKWFIKPKYTIVRPKQKEESKSGSKWSKCPSCGEIIFNSDLQKNMKVCTSCSHHFRITVEERIEMLVDEGSFQEFDAEISSADPLEFSDASGPYPQKLQRAKDKTGKAEGVVSGTAKIAEHDVVMALQDFRFLGGSMGSAVGEKIYRAIMKAYDTQTPLLIFSCSGGARMHEGILSLMQMAKTSSALARLAEKSVPYISIMTDPTTGGVTASFAMLGDIHIAEPGTLIGFAGPRVIEQTIKEKLPEGFQRAEFLLEKGFVDMVIDRREMKEKLIKLLDFFNN